MTTRMESIQRDELLKMRPWRNLRRIQYIAGRKVLHRFSGGIYILVGCIS